MHHDPLEHALYKLVGIAIFAFCVFLVALYA